MLTKTCNLNPFVCDWIPNSFLKILLFAEPTINRSHLAIGEEIGRGEFGVVHLATNKSTKEKYAVKTLINQTPESMEAFRKEAKQMEVLRHHNVIKVCASFMDEAPLMIVLEFMARGDLKSYLERFKQSQGLRLSHIIKLASDVASGFAYLQQMKYIHRDIAARNVMLDDNYVAKIGDFGMARQLHSSDYYQQGAVHAKSWTLPLRWMAPESYTDGTWDLKSDVWMFGVLLWEIFSFGTQPWSGLSYKTSKRGPSCRSRQTAQMSSTMTSC